MNKDFVRHFLAGFFSVFKISKTTIRKKPEADLLEYFIKIEKDINSTFQEIKKEYERE
ncbi:MAG: hypothetical protein LN568_01545 [Rickettsia endosymbiont of Pseudomimeciton antennatum]|nr:hypothetical protein [Rickettsia endosymbiont of Pseudomimeciton antennatum]MCC8397797.1 hypothetical protein [Rickettsia endosymbiont of Labidopullus appendiculatus]